MCAISLLALLSFHPMLHLLCVWGMPLPLQRDFRIKPAHNQKIRSRGTAATGGEGW